MVKVANRNKSLLERIEVEPMTKATKQRLAKAAEKIKDKAYFEEQTERAKETFKNIKL